MTSKRTRVALGLIVGVIVGVCAPKLGAVAFHSGSGSGNEPVRLVATGDTVVTGTARWESAGHPFTFEATRRDDLDAAADGSAQAAERAVTGTVTARGIQCTFSGSCREDTWTGVLSSGATGGNSFVVDPTLGYARFDGWLRDSHGTACRFRVEWFGSDGGGSSVTPRHGENDDARHVGADVTQERAATASVIAGCWGAFEDRDLGVGDGRLTATTDAVATSTTRPEDAHPTLICDEFGRCRQLLP